ncbi:hypothetical protein A0J61_09146 [Choanephora cucurbitarum]|uniref:Uncharacterized protein n=1 Tax=Choanephora cucurbitarum TaxID=101091 RepID=A0A1C7N140_9FUNG|nr:hypothetical protein A0J61_09146 [Choanephora cucurbitarum]
MHQHTAAVFVKLKVFLERTKEGVFLCWEWPKFRKLIGFDVQEESFGTKDATPLNFFSCFKNSSFLCLGELHLWGHNVARQLWNLISSGNDGKNRTQNVLFLKKKKREQTGQIMNKAKKNASDEAFEGALMGK